MSDEPDDMSKKAEQPRLIEVEFPLKQTSLDAIHEKGMRFGPISAIHVWPARRPLAACRAALITALLPDPGNSEDRKQLLNQIGGVVVKKQPKKKKTKKVGEERPTDQKNLEILGEETNGGVLHWGREFGSEMESLRSIIKQHYSNYTPKVLDPFAGGGAIPLEAMRLGCESYANDLNPVAWFLLKCTLEYPQAFAQQSRPLPSFALKNPSLLNDELKGSIRGKKSKNDHQTNSKTVQTSLISSPSLGLPWHVRAWGWWVLNKVKEEIGNYYPVFDNKTTVGYFWARTVKCKNCRVIIPLLKTRWLCKKDKKALTIKKRIVLPMKPKADNSGIEFGEPTEVSIPSGTRTQRIAFDKETGKGTMSRAGAKCPCCPATMTMEDIRIEGQAGRLGSQMIAVVVDGDHGKEYRLPTKEEILLVENAKGQLENIFKEIPFGLPRESTPAGGGSGAGRAFSIQGYGLMTWVDLFTPRQLLMLGTFVKWIRSSKLALEKEGYTPEWIEAITAYLAMYFDRLANHNTNLCRWKVNAEGVIGIISRYALPILWDFIEGNPLSDLTGGFASAMNWITPLIKYFTDTAREKPHPTILCQSAIDNFPNDMDLIVTDPPYYDSIPYSDLMDFFYVWLKRVLYGLNPEIDKIFKATLAPKWDNEKNNGELIDDESRFGNDSKKSKETYEEGMFRAFQSCNISLKSDGLLIIVFASKQPDAWETLVSAVIRAGFIVKSNWPIQTELKSRMRALSSAALSSSVWLVCRKRTGQNHPGWDNIVMEEMRKNISLNLRKYWDVGIRGPDFVWAAIGPALEVYSKFPIVKKANDPGKNMAVPEFLRIVRRIVVDFVVGRVLTTGEGESVINELDDITTYYLLHRHDFGMSDVPIGGCILYAVSCGLSDTALVDQYNILIRTGKKGSSGASEEEEEEEDASEESSSLDEEVGSGNTVKLRFWNQRKQKNLGYDTSGKPAPLIDQIHKLMQLWKEGDVAVVDEYISSRALKNHKLFHQLLQALIELAKEGDEERKILESISNHLGAKGRPLKKQEVDVFTAAERAKRKDGEGENE